MHNSIPLSSIHDKSFKARRELLEQAQNFGFALIEVDELKHIEALNTGIEEAQKLGSFRFPPINVERIEYSEVHRTVFKALFSIALECLSLLTEQDEHISTQVNALFSESEHEPFPLHHDFHPTFFNLFNYDHGALNTHQDRGLITIIHIQPPNTDLAHKSALWIEGADQKWRSGDAVIHAKQSEKVHAKYVLMLVGEEGERLFNTCGLEGVYAADHSVRVHPEGEFIEYSHHQRDPDSQAELNRLSAALILQKTIPDSIN